MASWEDVIITTAKVLNNTPGDRMAALVGGMADAEALVALKDLFNRLGCEELCTESSFPMEHGGNFRFLNIFETEKHSMNIIKALKPDRCNF